MVGEYSKENGRFVRPSYWGILPARVRYAPIPSSAKILFAEISALQNVSGCCEAGNAYFCDLYGINRRTLSRWLLWLQKAGFIKVEHEKIQDENGKFITRRAIWTLVDQYGKSRDDEGVQGPTKSPAGSTEDRETLLSEPGDIIVPDRGTFLSPGDIFVPNRGTFLSIPGDKNVPYNSTLICKQNSSNKIGAPAAHYTSGDDSKKTTERSERPAKSQPATQAPAKTETQRQAPDVEREGQKTKVSEPAPPDLFPGTEPAKKKLNRQELLAVVQAGREIHKRITGTPIDDRTINWAVEFRQINTLVARGYSDAEIIDLLQLLGAAREKEEYYAKETPILPSRLSLKIIQNLCQFRDRSFTGANGHRQSPDDFQRELAEKARKRAEMTADLLENGFGN